MNIKFYLLSQEFDMETHPHTLAGTPLILAEISATYLLGSTSQAMLVLFFFFEGPKGRYGPREAWAHMGWVGHPAH